MHLMDTKRHGCGFRSARVWLRVRLREL